MLRVGMDSQYGGFVAPIFPDNTFVFLPIPEDPHDKIKTYCDLKYLGKNISDYIPKDKILEDGHKKSRNSHAHADPEFNTNTYGEIKFLNKLRQFKKGDYLVFYSAMFPCKKDFKYKDLKLRDLGKLQSKKKQYFIIGFLELKYDPISKKDYKKFISEIKENVHYIRGDFTQNEFDVLLFKGTNESGFIKPIRIDEGLLANNYQMNDWMYNYKLDKNGRRGLNRAYGEINEKIIPELRNKLLKKQ